MPCCLHHFCSPMLSTPLSFPIIYLPMCFTSPFDHLLHILPPAHLRLIHKDPGGVKPLCLTFIWDSFLWCCFSAEFNCLKGFLVILQANFSNKCCWSVLIVVLLNAANQCKGFAKPLKSLTTLLCQTPCPKTILFKTNMSNLTYYKRYLSLKPHLRQVLDLERSVACGDFYKKASGDNLWIIFSSQSF